MNVVMVQNIKNYLSGGRPYCLTDVHITVSHSISLRVDRHHKRYASHNVDPTSEKLKFLMMVLSKIVSRRMRDVKNVS